VLQLEPLIAAQAKADRINTLKHQPAASIGSIEPIDVADTGKTVERLARIAHSAH
jgi:hypothetical protein